MKCVVSVFLLAMLAASCAPSEPLPDLSGHWKWVATQTDAKPDSTNPATPENSGKTRSIQFKGEHWLITNNGGATDSGSYRIGWEKLSFGEYVKALHFQLAGTSKDSVEYFKCYGDTLVFSQAFIGQEGVSFETYIKERK